MKNGHSILAFLLLLFVATGALAQQPDKLVRCGTDEVMLSNPEIRESVHRNFDYLQERLAMPRTDDTSEEIFRIPVVVHIVHMNGPENISDAQVRSQIRVLNEDYRKMAGTPGAGRGADAQIEFFLAKQDPLGNCTNGITRTLSPYTYHGPSESLGSTEQQLKSLVHWESAQYLNIYLVHSIGINVLGYSPVGVSSSPELDGVVVTAKHFGDRGAVDGPYDRGRTTTHEVGHWLGLLHTFQSGCFGSLPDNCATGGDRVCDTPQAEQPTEGCPDPLEVPNSCNDQPVDLPDMYENYLDYTDDSCMSMFTQGQVEIMQQTLRDFRSFIFSEQNLLMTGYYGCTTSRLEDAVAATPRVYPNPANGSAKIASELLSQPGASVELTDVSGRLVRRFAPGSFNVSDSEARLDLTGIAPGAYIISVISPESKARARLLVQ